MDESLPDLELELTALKPRSLRQQLVDRVGKQLAPSVAETGTARRPQVEIPVSHSLWPWLVSGLVGCAATVVAVFMAFHFSTHEASDDIAKDGTIVANPSAAVIDDRYQPVAASNVLYEMKDEGAVTARGESAERRVRYRYVDTYTWKNPRNNASLTWSVPRDEIRLQPVQFN